MTDKITYEELLRPPCVCLSPWLKLHDPTGRRWKFYVRSNLACVWMAPALGLVGIAPAAAVECTRVSGLFMQSSCDCWP